MKKAFYVYLLIVSTFFITILVINSKNKDETYRLEGFYYYINNEYVSRKKMKIDLFFNKENISFREIEKNEYLLVDDDNVFKIICRRIDIKEEIEVLGTKFYRFCFEFFIDNEIGKKCILQIKNDLEELEISLAPIINVDDIVIYEVNNFYYIDEKLLFKGGEALERLKYLDNIYDVKKNNQYYEIENIKLDMKNVLFDVNLKQAFLIFSFKNDLDFKKIERISIKWD